MKKRICILAALAALSVSAVPMATEHYVDEATNNVYAALTNDPYRIKSKVANIPTVDVLEFNVCRVGESNRVEWIKPLVTWVGQLINSEIFDGITAANSYTDSKIDEIPSWAKEESPPAETDPTVPSWAKSANPPTETDPTVPAWAKAVNPPTETDPTVPAWAKAAHAPVTSLEPSTNYTDTAVRAAETRLNETNAATRAIVYSWEAYIGGSNVVHSITNYISGDYPLDDGKYKIYELRDGTYRELYNSHTDITNHIHAFKMDEIDPALTRMENTVNDALDGKADKDWGKYTSAGERNEMTNTVWITHPETVFGGGTEWRRVAVGEGSVAFLVNSKQQIHTAGEEGKFYFSDWGYTNKFGFATTASYTIGIDPDSIHVEGATGIVSVGFDVTMDGMPVIWYCNDLSLGAWEQLNLTDGSPTAGASHVVAFDTTSTPGWIYAFINCTNDPQGFFRATVEHAGGASFFTSMPADFQGGIMCTDSVHKVSIDWNGGAPRLVPFAGE